MYTRKYTCPHYLRHWTFELWLHFKNLLWIELRRCVNVCLSSIIFFFQMQSHSKSSHLSHITELSAPASFHNTSNYNSRVWNSAIHLTHDTNVASMCRTYQITLTTDLTMLVSMPSPDTPRDCATSLTIFSETYITFWDSRLIKQCICRQESFRGPGRHCRPSFLFGSIIHVQPAIFLSHTIRFL